MKLILISTSSVLIRARGACVQHKKTHSQQKIIYLVVLKAEPGADFNYIPSGYFRRAAETLVLHSAYSAKGIAQ